MVSAGLGDFFVLSAIQETLKIAETRSYRRRRRREVRCEGRRRKPTKIGESPEGFSKTFFKVSFMEKFFLDMSGGPLFGTKKIYGSGLLKENLRNHLVLSVHS